ncbi:hypothetical protein [Tessaracoccus sp. OH4464_COT-324]|uniref:hypothetical protein n=1 Tax=Tessaracoccus sp. OH4464_COT-324 TaxID=2491059 RepID=UPI000F642E08|nr:hypothetical protein [Tessaracoccus sp. OH4464_COT-324]RRD46492.1 hypothetical protein EII42_06775 [Tessaracoccus sp. OH4464_COT-324]
MPPQQSQPGGWPPVPPQQKSRIKWPLIVLAGVGTFVLGVGGALWANGVLGYLLDFEATPAKPTSSATPRATASASPTPSETPSPSPSPSPSPPTVLSPPPDRPNPTASFTMAGEAWASMVDENRALIHSETETQLVDFATGQVLWHNNFGGVFSGADARTDSFAMVADGKIQVRKISDASLYAETPISESYLNVVHCGGQTVVLTDNAATLYPSLALSGPVELTDSGYSGAEGNPVCRAVGDTVVVGWDDFSVFLLVRPDGLAQTDGVILDEYILDAGEVEQMFASVGPEAMFLAAVRTEQGWNIAAASFEAKKTAVLSVDGEANPIGEPVVFDGQGFESGGAVLAVHREGSVEIIDLAQKRSLNTIAVGDDNSLKVDRYGNVCRISGGESSVYSWDGPGTVSCQNPATGETVFTQELAQGDSLSYDGELFLRWAGQQTTVFR